MADVSSTRLYLGNLPRNATKADVENHFATHGTGKITEIKLMNGFGFVEYEDPMDARDVVPGEPLSPFHGSDFMGERLVVQFARGSRREGQFPHPSERPPPRPRRTPWRMSITGLPVETSWQDLKDFARQSGLDVVYSEVGRNRDGTGFVEYETAADLRSAVEKLNEREFKGQTVRCIADEQPDRGGSRYRSRSPPPMRGRGYPPGPPGGGWDDYDRRGPPPRGYSPRREDYRRRSPPRDYYGGGERERWGRSPPPARRGPPPADDGYGPPRGRYDDGYDARGPPPPRGGPRYDEPYSNGHGAGGGRPPYAGGPPSPRRRSPGAAGGGRPPYPPADGGYDRRGGGGY